MCLLPSSLPVFFPFDVTDKALLMPAMKPSDIKTDSSSKNLDRRQRRVPSNLICKF